MHFLKGGSEGQTPLDLDEAEGLLPSWVSTRADLDRAEQDNILRAEAWARGRKLRPAQLLTEAFIRRLHRRMFEEVWEWAGKYRQTNKNIGVDYWLIREAIGQFLGNAIFWVENETYEPDELAVRFHFHLVAIHPFPNGNGRMSRTAADLLVEALGGDRFTWGVVLARSDPAAARAAYIGALHAADREDFDLLFAFARS